MRNLIENISRLFYHLKPPTKIKFLALLLLSILQAFLEIVFIAAVTIIIIGEIDNIPNSLSYVISSSSFLDQLFILLAITILVIIMKCANIFFTKRLCVTASEDLVYEFTEKMFGCSSKHFFSMDRNDTITNFTSRLTTVTYGFVFPMLNAVNASISILLIVAYATSADLTALFGIIIVVGYFILVTLITERYRNSIGNSISKLLSLMNERITEVLEFYRELKVHGLEKKHQTTLRDTNTKFRNALGNLVILSFIPRFLLEGVLVGFCILTFFLYRFLEIDTDTLKGALVLFFTASARLIPSAQSFYTSYNTMTANSHQLSTLIKAIPPTDIQAGEKLYLTTGQNLIELRAVELTSYDGRNKILEKFSYEFPAKGLIGIVGASGSGKSTLVDALLGLYNFSDGECYVRPGVKFALSQQKSPIKTGSLRDNISLYSKDKVTDIDLIKYSKDIGLLNESLSLDSKINLENLSGGQIKKISFLRTYIANADIYIFDEPTSGLDSVSVKQVLALLKLKSATSTVICITHDNDLIESLDQVIFIR